jgi:probable phosphoglycerate mutase
MPGPTLGAVAATEVLIVRHGQSEWNALGRWQGTEDPPLSPLGLRQAELAAERLPDGFDTVWSSDLQRAHATAQTMATRRGLGPVSTFPGLRERYAGDWQGLTRAEIEAGWPGYLADGRRPDGWEGDESIVERVLETFLGDGGPRSRLLIVAHGGVIICLDRFLGEPFQRYPNLSGRWFRFEDGQLSAGDRIALVSESVDRGVD